MTIGDRRALSSRAQHIGTALRNWPRRRVPLTDLWRLLDDADPATRTFVHRRQLLAEALDELAAAGAIRLPSRRSYDRTEVPPLPSFITMPGNEQTSPSRGPVVWHPALSWAADERLAPGQRLMLEKVNRWLFTNPADLVVPLRERSIEIVGDEKALDRLQATNLFAPGRLTLDLLRARRVAPPMHTIQIGDGPILLVVENSDTFDSLTTALRPTPGLVGFVGWGAGTAFEASILSVARTAQNITDIAYFGDLDAKGLQVPANANRQASTAGLPAVRPATGLYTALHRNGHHQSETTRIDASTADQLTTWLAPQHRQWARDLLTTGKRVAQEATGLSYLLRHDDWRTDLTDPIENHTRTVKEDGTATP